MLFSNVLIVAPCLLSVALASPNVFERQAACKVDNCLRAVRASASLSAHLSDCSTNAIVTVTPCPVTSTVSATTTSTLDTLTTTTSTTTTETGEATSVITTIATQYFKRGAGNGLNARIVDEAPTCTAPATYVAPAPTYATACSGVPRYSSACSCLGVTATTTVLAPVTVYVTNTLSLTETPLATETSTLISSETLTTTTTATETSNVPYPTCTSTSTPDHIEVPGSTTCGCTYNVDCSSDYTFDANLLDSLHLVPYANTVTDCRNACDQLYNCGAFIFDFYTSIDTEFSRCQLAEISPSSNPVSIKLDDGSAYFGLRTSDSCVREPNCDITNYEPNREVGIKKVAARSPAMILV